MCVHVSVHVPVPARSRDYWYPRISSPCKNIQSSLCVGVYSRTTQRAHEIKGKQLFSQSSLAESTKGRGKVCDIPKLIALLLQAMFPENERQMRKNENTSVMKGSCQTGRFLYQNRCCLQFPHELKEKKKRKEKENVPQSFIELRETSIRALKIFRHELILVAYLDNISFTNVSVQIRVIDIFSNTMQIK